MSVQSRNSSWTLHLKNIKCLCKIQKNSKNGKINGVLNQEGEKLKYFSADI